MIHLVGDYVLPAVPQSTGLIKVSRRVQFFCVKKMLIENVIMSCVDCFSVHPKSNWQHVYLKVCL